MRNIDGPAMGGLEGVGRPGAGALHERRANGAAGEMGAGGWEPGGGSTMGFWAGWGWEMGGLGFGAEVAAAGL